LKVCKVKVEGGFYATSFSLTQSIHQEKSPLERRD
jgi:hypothetical protein